LADNEVQERQWSKGVALPDMSPRDLSNIQVVDIASGEALASHPGELVLVDDLEGHYSHSFIRKYTTCSASAFFQKMKAPKKPIYALERGIVIHEALEAFEVYQKDPLKVADELWKLRVLDKYSQFRASDRDKVDGKGYEETMLMISDWLYENRAIFESGNVKPEDVEVEFDLPVTIHTAGGDFKRRFLGKLDLVLWNKARTDYMIFDYKSSASAPNEDELADDVQFTLYQWAATQMFGKPPHQMNYYLLKGKHICKGSRFTDDKGKHPRKPECLQYAFPVPLRTERQIADYFQNYVAPGIINYEAGVVSKEGKADPQMCHRCEFKEFCDTYDLPLPRFARVGQVHTTPKKAATIRIPAKPRTTKKVIPK
jgi:hypothetical protein